MAARLGGSAGGALARRLRDNELTRDDVEKYELAKQIWELRAESLSYRMIAGRLGAPHTPRSIQDFATRGIYRIFIDHWKAAERGEPEAVARETKDHQQTTRSLIPLALKRWRQTLLGSFDKEGNPLKNEAADRAAERVLKAAGILDAETGNARPAVIVCPAGLAHAAHAICADDARIAALTGAL